MSLVIIEYSVQNVSLNVIIEAFNVFVDITVIVCSHIKSEFHGTFMGESQTCVLILFMCVLWIVGILYKIYMHVLNASLQMCS